MSEGRGGDDGEIFGVERGKAIKGIAIAAGLSLAAVAALGQITGYGELLDAIRRATAWWFGLLLLGQLVAYLGYVVAYRDVVSMRDGPRFGYGTTAQVVGLGLGAYVFAAAAGSLGVDFWAMRRAGIETHDAARRTLALNTLQAAALAAFTAAGGVVVLVTGVHGRAALVMALAWIAAVPLVVGAAAFVSHGERGERLADAPDGEQRPSGLDAGAWLGWLGAKLRKGLADGVGAIVYVRHVLAHPLRFKGGVLGYPLFWVGDFFTLWVALRAFGVDIGPERLVLAEGTAWALTLLPLPAGGSGFAEASMAFALHALGVPLTPALFATLIYRTVNFWLPLLPALALLTRVKKLHEELPRYAREEGEPEPAAA